MIYLRNVLREDPKAYGTYRSEGNELIFVPRQGAEIPADRISEWSISRSATGGKVRFFDKPAAIALARSIGVFDRAQEAESEDFSDEALFGPEE